VIAAGDLDELTFTPAANANGAGHASFTFSVQDSTGAFDAAPNTITVDVTAVNDAPTISVDGTVACAAGAAAVVVDATITLTDVDNATLAGATVSIGNFQAGDQLNFTNQNGITGSYADGVLTLSGSASVAQYETALESVTFSSSSGVHIDRTVSFSVSDGTVTSAADTATVNVSEVRLGQLDGTTGFRMSGVNAYDRSAWSVSDAGDVNGDGFADLVIGAPRDNPYTGGTSASYVVFGKASGFAASIDANAVHGSDSPATAATERPPIRSARTGPLPL